MTDQEQISCDGGSLGHPRVFLALGDQKQVECPYCGKNFQKSE